jgi:hypothetical protein
VFEAWAAEAPRVDFAAPAWSAAAANFTQIVWTATKSVGCAVNPTCAEGALYLCFYRPQGNVLGANWSRRVLPRRKGGGGGSSASGRAAAPGGSGGGDKASPSSGGGGGGGGSKPAAAGGGTKPAGGGGGPAKLQDKPSGGAKP